MMNKELFTLTYKNEDEATGTLRVTVEFSKEGGITLPVVIENIRMYLNAIGWNDKMIDEEFGR